jgi:hypothetical protein
MLIAHDVIMDSHSQKRKTVRKKANIAAAIDTFEVDRSKSFLNLFE